MFIGESIVFLCIKYIHMSKVRNKLHMVPGKLNLDAFHKNLFINA